MDLATATKPGSKSPKHNHMLELPQRVLASIGEDVIHLLGDLEPDQVFEDGALEAWAIDNGFVKVGEEKAE